MQSLYNSLIAFTFKGCTDSFKQQGARDIHFSLTSCARLLMDAHYITT